MEKIIVYSEDFKLIIHELILILYKNEYFGFEDSAINYAHKIYDFIFENIDKPTTKNNFQPKFKKHGENYLKYKANNRTTWYIFFAEKDGKYLVNYIINNHSEKFRELL